MIRTPADAWRGGAMKGEGGRQRGEEVDREGKRYGESDERVLPSFCPKGN
jgi:hypothetical protein